MAEAREEDPGILIDPTKVDAGTLLDRAREAGRITGASVEVPVPQLDEDATATALYAVWDLISEAKGSIESETK